MVEAKDFQKVFASVLTEQSTFLFGPQADCRYKASPKVADTRGSVALTPSWLLFLPDDTLNQEHDVQRDILRESPVAGLAWPLRHLTAHAKHPKKPMTQLRFERSRCEIRKLGYGFTSLPAVEMEPSVCILDFTAASSRIPPQNLVDLFSEKLSCVVARLGLLSTSASYTQCLEEETARLEQLKAKVLEFNAARDALTSKVSMDSKQMALTSNPEIESLFSELVVKWGVMSAEAFWARHRDVIACTVDLPKPLPSLQQISSVPVSGPKRASSKPESVSSEAASAVINVGEVPSQRWAAVLNESDLVKLRFAELVLGLDISSSDAATSVLGTPGSAILDMSPDPDSVNKMSAVTFWHRFLRSKKGRIMNGGAAPGEETEPIFDSKESVEIDAAQKARQFALPADLRPDVCFLGEDVFARQNLGFGVSPLFADSVLRVDSAAAGQIEQMAVSGKSQAALIGTYSAAADAIVSKFNQQASNAVRFQDANVLKLDASRLSDADLVSLTDFSRSGPGLNVKDTSGSDLSALALGSFSPLESLTIQSAMVSSAVPLTLKQQTQKGLKKIVQDRNRRSAHYGMLDDLCCMKNSKNLSSGLSQLVKNVWWAPNTSISQSEYKTTVKSVKQRISNSRNTQIVELDETTSKIGFIQCTNALRQRQSTMSIKSLNQSVAQSAGLMELVDMVADIQFKVSELIGHFYGAEPQNRSNLVVALEKCSEELNKIISGYETEEGRARISDAASSLTARQLSHSVIHSIACVTRIKGNL